MMTRDCIFFQLAKAHQTASRFWKDRLAPLHLTTAQATVLAFLSEEDGITSAELGKRIQLDSATLTGLINRLEAVNLVARLKDREDRRAVRVCLTPRGRGLGRQVVDLTAKAHHEFLLSLDGAADRQLTGLLEKISKPFKDSEPDRNQERPS
jgi:DNA-binding MarR family transcriptional regulator